MGPGVPADGLAHRAAGIAVVSLDVRLEGGSAWVCLPDEAGGTTCGVNNSPAVPVARTWYIERGATDTGHDGSYVVGPTTASPPALGER